MINTAVVTAAWALWMAWGGFEEFRAGKRLATIRYRLLCGGIRGKSSLTRLVHAGLRAAGLEALGRVTGEDPLLLLPDGREIPHARRGPANIREVRALLGLKHAERLDAIVIENMAIEPELQGVVARRFVRPTLQLFACDGTDHLETLPADPIERAEALLDGFDPRAPLMVADYAENRILRERATARGLRIAAPAPAPAAAPAPAPLLPDDQSDQTDQTDQSDQPDFPLLRPHIAPLAECALGALREMDCLTPKTRMAVLKRAAELQKLTVYRLGESVWVDLLTANDPESVRRLIECVLRMDAANGFVRKAMLFNHRNDRPLRLYAFAPLFCDFETLIVGDRISRSRAAKLSASWTSTPPPELERGRNLIFLTGNAGGRGKILRARLAAEGKVEQW